MSFKEKNSRGVTAEELWPIHLWSWKKRGKIVGGGKQKRSKHESMASVNHLSCFLFYWRNKTLENKTQATGVWDTPADCYSHSKLLHSWNTSFVSPFPFLHVSFLCIPLFFFNFSYQVFSLIFPPSIFFNIVSILFLLPIFLYWTL